MLIIKRYAIPRNSSGSKNNEKDVEKKLIAVVMHCLYMFQKLPHMQIFDRHGN